MKRKLLIVTTEYFHPLRHRLHHILPFLLRDFEIKIVAMAPALYDVPSCMHVWARAVVGMKKILRRKVLQEQDRVLIIRNPLLEVGGDLIRIFLEIIGRAIFAAWIIKLKKVHSGFDVCLASSYLGAFSALLAKMPMPIVYEDVDRFEFLVEGTFARKIIGFIERYCIRNSAGVISAGYSLAKSAEAIRRNRVYCIPNGIDLRFFENIHDDENKEDIFSIVYLGSISPWCGLELAIKSLPLIISEFPKTKLTVIGFADMRSAPYVRKLKALAEKLNVRNKVIFSGPRKYNELPSIISKYAIGLATFQKTEVMQYAFTYKVIEYMAAGLPVIATDVGDTGKIIKEYKCGVIVESTPESVAEGVRRLFRNREYMLMLGKNGRQSSKDFDLRVLAEKEINVLSQFFN